MPYRVACRAASTLSASINTKPKLINNKTRSQKTSLIYGIYAKGLSRFMELATS